ncbi:MAG: cytochrome c [Thermoanaerobaculales bacterium]
MKRIKTSRIASAMVGAITLTAAIWATAGTAKTLDGAKVYAANCGNCHSQRYPSERTDKEWSVIVMHMQVRARLTGDEARAVLRYLQANNKDGRKNQAGQSSK